LIGLSIISKAFFLKVISSISIAKSNGLQVNPNAPLLIFGQL